MKKTLLLSALVASAASFAGTTGSVEGFVKTSTDFIKGGVHSTEISNSELRYGSTFDVKVDNSGFSFGGTLHNKTSFNMFSNQLVDGYFNSKKSNLWVKYDLPEYKGIKSYVKGKVDALPGKDFIGTVELNAEKELNGLTLTLNNKTKFPSYVTVPGLSIPEGKGKGGVYRYDIVDSKKVDGNKVKGTGIIVNKYIINNTTTLTAKKDLENIKELKGELELGTSVVVNNITKDLDGSYFIKNARFTEDDLQKGFKPVRSDVDFNFNYLNANISGKYLGIKDLEIKGELNGIYNHRLNNSVTIADGTKEAFDLEDIIDNITKVGKFAISSRVDAKYTGIKDTTLTGGLQLIYNNNITPNKVSRDGDVLTDEFFEYHSVVEKADLILPVFRAGVEYKGVENLTLSAKTLITKPFIVNRTLKETKTADELKAALENKSIKYMKAGVVYLNANAKYDYKATNKLTISPEATVETYSFFVKDTNAHLVALTPKVSAEYKANDNLVFKGNVSTTSLFGIEKDHSGYIATNVKTGLSVKYTW